MEFFLFCVLIYLNLMRRFTGFPASKYMRKVNNSKFFLSISIANFEHVIVFWEPCKSSYEIQI